MINVWLEDEETIIEISDLKSLEELHINEKYIPILLPYIIHMPKLKDINFHNATKLKKTIKYKKCINLMLA